MTSEEKPQEGLAALKSRASGAAGWTMGSYAGTQLVRLIANLIVTRLMYTEAFGLMVLVSVFLQGLALFSDIGVGPSIIQSPRGNEPRFVNTAWTMQVMRGGLLWTVTLLGAVPFALAYDAPELKQLIPVVGFTVIVEGLASTKLFSSQRDLSIKRIAIVEVTSQVLGSIVMIVWAYMSRSVWALAAGGMSIAIFKTTLSHLVLKGIGNRFAWEKEAAKDIFQFGRWLLLSTALHFIGSQSDRLLFGKLVSLSMLGIYHIALTLASMPLIALTHMVRAVLLPILSRANEGDGDFNEIFWATRRPILLVGGFLMATFGAAGQPIVNILYDSRYTQAGWILQLITIGSWITLMENTVTQALLARGYTAWLAASSGIRIVAVAVMLPAGYYIGGFAGAVLGFALSNGAQLALMLWAARSKGMRGFEHDLRYTVRTALAAVAGHFAAQQVPSGVDNLPMAFLGALVASVVVALFWVGPALTFIRERRQKGSLAERVSVA